MTRHACLIGLTILALGITAPPAAALTIGGSAPDQGVAVDSFVFDGDSGQADETLAGCATAGEAPAAVVIPGVHTEADADLSVAARKSSYQTLYYVSSVPTPVARTVLSGSGSGNNAWQMGNPAPEPSAGLLLLGGLGGLLRRNKKKRS